jgi:hypothetical protein
MTVALALVAVALIAPSPGSLAVSGDAPNDGAKGTPSDLNPGILLAPVAAIVLVNGNEVRTGATIFPGSMLNTLEAGATVRLDPLGRIDIDPKTKLKLDFSEGQIRVELSSGCVILTANKGVVGEVHTPLGATTRTDPNYGGTIDACAGDQGLVLYGVKDSEARACGRKIFVPPPFFGPYLFAVGAPVILGVLAADNEPRPQTASPTTP